jgi:hypothetical protein
MEESRRKTVSPASRPSNRVPLRDATAADTGDSKYDAYYWEVRANRTPEPPCPELLS